MQTSCWERGRAAASRGLTPQITDRNTKDIEGMGGGWEKGKQTNKTKKPKPNNPGRQELGTALPAPWVPEQLALRSRRTQEPCWGGICSYCRYRCHLCVFLYIPGVCVHIFVCLPYVRIAEGGIAVDIAEILLLSSRRIRAMLTHN